jgi:hypothetical protein
MENAHLKSILTEVAQASERDGWFEAAEGKTLTLYANRNGTGVNAQKVTAVKIADELIHARTVRGETYVFYLADVFAAVIDGTSDTSKRKAGFVLAA